MDKIQVLIPDSLTMTFGIMYIIIIVAMCCYGVIKNKEKLNIQRWSKITERKKICLKRVIVGSGALGAICWFMSSYCDDQSLLMKICEKYLRYEPILIAGVLLFLVLALFTIKNKYKHVEAVNKIVQYVIPLSLGFRLIEQQVNLNNWPNRIAVVIICIFWILLIATDCELIKSREEEKCVLGKVGFDMSYNPIESLEGLFPQHKAQAEHIADIIEKSSCEPFSICLSGEWGFGKNFSN